MAPCRSICRARSFAVVALLSGLSKPWRLLAIAATLGHTSAARTRAQHLKCVVFSGFTETWPRG